MLLLMALSLGKTDAGIYLPVVLAALNVQLLRLSGQTQGSQKGVLALIVWKPEGDLRNGGKTRQVGANLKALQADRVRRVRSASCIAP